MVTQRLAVCNGKPDRGTEPQPASLRLPNQFQVSYRDVPIRDKLGWLRAKQWKRPGRHRRRQSLHPKYRDRHGGVQRHDAAGLKFSCKIDPQTR